MPKLSKRKRQLREMAQTLSRNRLGYPEDESSPQQNYQDDDDSDEDSQDENESAATVDASALLDSSRTRAPAEEKSGKPSTGNSISHTASSVGARGQNQKRKRSSISSVEKSGHATNGNNPSLVGKDAAKIAKAGKDMKETKDNRKSLSVAKDEIDEAAAAASKGSTKATDGSSASSSVADDRVWVLCNSCGKWRSLPSTVDVESLPEIWTCNQNSYDPDRMSCDAPEEEYKQSEEDQHVEIKSFLRVWVKRMQNRDRAERSRYNSYSGNTITRGSANGGPGSGLGGAGSAGPGAPTMWRTAAGSSSINNSSSSGSSSGGGKKRKQQPAEVEWIQCCNPSCGKWRSVIRSIDTAALLMRLNRGNRKHCGGLDASSNVRNAWHARGGSSSAEWYCCMNFWDDTTASCSAPQEPLWDCPWNMNNKGTLSSSSK